MKKVQSVPKLLFHFTISQGEKHIGIKSLFQTPGSMKFQCKNLFEKRTTLGRDILEKTKWG